VATKAPGKAPAKAPGKPAKTTGPAKKAPNPAPKAAPKTREAGTGAARARVPASRAAARSPRTPFVLLILALLSGALISLLLLNTVLAKDAFTLTELQQSNKQLIQQRQALEESNAREESPANLARKAQALGMGSPKQWAYVDPQTGQVVGTLRPVPRAAAAAAGAAGVLGVPGAVLPGDGVAGWTGTPKAPAAKTPAAKTGAAKTPAAKGNGSDPGQGSATGGSP
jgi:hypothetical protein